MSARWYSRRARSLGGADVAVPPFGLDFYFGVTGGKAGAGRLESGVGGVAESGKVGGVIGIALGGLTEVSIDVLALASPDIVPLAIGAVAEVSTDAPVEALALDQSLLARTLGEAFR